MITQAIGRASLGAQACWWEEQVDGLEAHICDGQVIMWRDDDHNVWLPQEKPPAKWKSTFRHHKGTAPFLLGGLGATAAPGVCTPHKPVPLTKIRRLQDALRGLATRVRDGSLRIAADGLVGPRTVAATNRAMVHYVQQPEELATGRLTHAQVAAFAAQLTAYIDKAPHAASSASTSVAPAPPATTSPASYATPPQGESSMPSYAPGPEYYAPQPAYYQPPPTYYGPPRGPGGLPADRASLDVKAFVPAQYEHIRVDPTTVMFVILAGVGVYLVATRKKAS